MKRFVSALLAALALASAVSLEAQSQQKSEPVDLTGEWIMNLESHQLGLELHQIGTKVEGVLYAMGGRQALVGAFIDGTLALRGERPNDGSADERRQDGDAIVARLLENGTLAGELSSRHGRVKWTGERLKKPRAE
jgi:hypothetical protein